MCRLFLLMCAALAATAQAAGPAASLVLQSARASR